MISILTNLTTGVLVPALILASLFTVLLTINTALKFQSYETSAKRASKVSSAAADQLSKTRTTQFASVFASITSLLTSLVFLRAAWHISSSSGFEELSMVTWAIVFAAQAGTCLAAKAYMMDFYGDKWDNAAGAVPGMADWSVAVRGARRVGAVLEWLGYGWCVIGVLFIICV